MHSVNRRSTSTAVLQSARVFAHSTLGISARAASRLQRRGLVLGPALTLCVIFSGCAANDPNINPKARWAMQMYSESVALQNFNPRNYYERTETMQVNPRTGREERLLVYRLREQPVLPAGFVVAYDPVERRSMIRSARDVYDEDIATLPGGPKRSTASRPSATP